MSLREDGRYRCDRCGRDVGNAGIDVATKIARFNPQTGTQENLDLCIEPRDGAPAGCAGTVLGPGTLADWTAYQARKDTAT